MANVATVTASFRAEAAQFLKELKRVNDESKRTGNTIVKDLGGALRSLAGIVSVGVFASFVRQQGQIADQSAKTADALGVQTERLQALRFAARGAGVDVGLLDRALGESQKRLSEALSGKGDAAKWLDRLKLDVRELVRLSPDQLFERYAEAIGTLNNRGEQFEATQALLGKGTQGLINLITGGSDAIRQAGEDIRQLGIEMSRIDQRQIEQANDELERAKAVTEGIGQRFAVAVAPFVGEFARGMVESAKATEDLNGKIETAVRVAYYGFNLAANAVKVFDVAVSGVVLILSKLEETFTGALGSIVQKSADLAEKVGLDALSTKLKAASAVLGEVEGFTAAMAERAGDRVQNALAGIKSFEQIGQEADRIVATARARAEAAQRDAGVPGRGDPTADLDRAAFEDLKMKGLIDELEREQKFRDEMHERALSQEKAFSSQMLSEAVQREGRYFEILQENEQRILDLKTSAASYAIQLLQTLGQKNKAFALAALVFEKALAIQKILISTKVAAAAALEPPPIGLGPVAGAALAAKITALGYLNAGLVAALGVAQAANLFSSGGNAPGSPTNPINTTSALGGANSDQPASEKGVTQIYIQPGFWSEENLQQLRDMLEELDNRDVVVFSGQSAQANAIRAGTG